MRAETSTAAASSSSSGRTTTFELPVSAPSLFIRTVNSNYTIQGELNMTVSREPGHVIYVRVSGTSEKCRAKLVQEHDGSTGIEFYYEGLPFWFAGARLIIDVRFPAPQPGAPYTYVKEFTTSLGMFTHEIAYLAPRVKFGTLRLQGKSSINVEAISAETANVKTSHASIKGSFHADEYLRLDTSHSTIKGSFSSNGAISVMTSNSSIEGEVKLFNSGDGTPSKADLATSNSKINVEVILTAVNNMGGAFKVDASTSNAKLDVVCSSAPIDSELVLKANTSNANVRVDLPPTYQGKVSASTSHGKATLESDPPALDPTGLGRERIIKMSKTEDREIHGEVRWSEHDDWKVAGKVDVNSSNCKILVRLK